MTRQLRPQRQGSIVLEAILALPVLVLVSLAAVQYGQTILFEQAVGAAADEAAREAAKGANADDVADVVESMLSPFGLTVGGATGVRVDVEQSIVPMTETRGDMSVPSPTAISFTTAPVATLNADEIRVTVQVNYTATMVPNMLGYFGIDFSGKRLRYSALSQRQ